MRPYAFATLLITVLTSFTLRAADFTGRWEGMPTLPDGTQFKAVVEFTAANDGKLTGSVETSEFGTFTANDIVVAGDTITFNVATDGGTYYNTGTLKPDGLLVGGTGPDGPLAPVLYRRPAADLSGKWRGTVRTPDGAVEIIYTFATREGKVFGTVSGAMGEAALTNIMLDGDRVSFAGSYAGYTILRRGTISGDTMQLTIIVDGNELSATFTRERGPAETRATSK